MDNESILCCKDKFHFGWMFQTKPANDACRILTAKINAASEIPRKEVQNIVI